MTMQRVILYTVAATAACAAIGAVAWFVQRSKEFDHALAVSCSTAKGIHKTLMGTPAYATADLGNRVMWITPMVEEAIGIICVNLNEEKTKTIRDYVVGTLKDICSTEEGK